MRGGTKWSPHLYILELLLGMLLSIFFDPSKLPLAVKALIIGATSFFIPYICYNDPHHCLSIWPLSHLYEALSIRETPAMALVLGFVLATCLVLYIALCYVFTKFITLKYERSTTEYKIMTIGAAIGVFVFVLFLSFTSVMNSAALAPAAGLSGSGVEASKSDHLRDDFYPYNDNEEEEELELDCEPFDRNCDGKLSKSEKANKKDYEKLVKEMKKEREKKPGLYHPGAQPPSSPHHQHGAAPVAQGQLPPTGATTPSLGWLRALKKSYLDFAVNNPAIYYGCWIIILATCVGCAYLIWKENMIPSHAVLPLHPAAVAVAVPPMTQPPGPGLAEQPPAFAFPTYIDPNNAATPATGRDSEDSADDEDSEHEPPAAKASTGQRRLSRQASATSLATPQPHSASGGRSSSTFLTPPVLITRATSPSLRRRRNSKSDRDGDEGDAAIQDFGGGHPATRATRAEERASKRMSLPSLSLPSASTRRVSPLPSPRSKTSADLIHDAGLDGNVNGNGGDLYRNPPFNSTSTTPTAHSRKPSASTPKRQAAKNERTKPKAKTGAKKEKKNRGSASDEGWTSTAASGSEREAGEEDSGAGVCRGGYERRQSVGSGTERNDARPGEGRQRNEDEEEEQVEEEREAEVEDDDDDEQVEDTIKEVIKESISEELGAKFWRERERTMAELESLKQRYERERHKYRNLKQTFAQRMREADEQADRAKRNEARARAELEQRLTKEKAADLDALQRSVDEAARKNEEMMHKKNEDERARAERIKRKLAEERQRNEELNRRLDDERAKVDEITRRMDDERTKNEERLVEERTRHESEKRATEEAMKEMEMRMKRASDGTGEEAMALELYKKIDEERAKADEWRRRLDAEYEKVERLKGENEAEKQKNHELSLQIDEMSAKMTEILMNVTHLNFKEADTEAERLKQEKRKAKQESKLAAEEKQTKKTKDKAEKKEKEKEGLPTPNIVVSASPADGATAANGNTTPAKPSLFSPRKSEKRRSVTLTPVAVGRTIASPDTSTNAAPDASGMSPSPSPDTSPIPSPRDAVVDAPSKPAEKAETVASTSAAGANGEAHAEKEAQTTDATTTTPTVTAGSDSALSTPVSSSAESSPVLLSPVKPKSEKRRSVTLTPTAIRHAAAAAASADPIPVPTGGIFDTPAKADAPEKKENGHERATTEDATAATTTANGNGVVSLLSTPTKSKDSSLLLSPTKAERRRSATPTPKAKSS